MLTDTEREKIIRRAAERYYENMKAMKQEEQQITYLMQLIRMFDDQKLRLIDFSLDMNPTEKERNAYVEEKARQLRNAREGNEE